MENCETCHGDGNEEYWDDETQAYRSRSCTACGGAGQVETMGSHELPDLGADPDVEYPEETTSYERLHGHDEEDDMARADHENDEERDHKAFHESFGFDKFMDSTLIKESRACKHDEPTTSPMRVLAARRQERPMGRTRFVRKP